VDDEADIPKPARSAAAIAALDALWDSFVPNSGLSRNTPLFNSAQAAKETLKAALSHIDD
jgi:hypothetical protein